MHAFLFVAATDTPDVFGQFVVVLLVALGVTVSAFVGAFILRASCSIYNSYLKRIASTTLIAEPKFGAAFRMLLLTNGITIGIRIALDVFFGGQETLAKNDDAQYRSFPILMATILGSQYFMAVILRGGLRTTTRGAVAVSLIYLAITSFVGGIVVLVLLATGFLSL